MEPRHWHITGKVLTTLIMIAIVVAVGVVALLIHHGLRARDKPSLLETWIALSVRHLATPSSMRNARNPLPLTPAVLADARAHWADHCAACHANDGSGDTEMGRGMYPHPPDMRKAQTQDLSDGELFSIIKNGIRLTGMPSWGGVAGHDDADNWKLVFFIRHLPNLTPDEATQMEALNPKTPDEWREMQTEAAFLAGSDKTPMSATASHHHDH